MSSDDDTPRSTDWSSGPARDHGARDRRPDGGSALPPELDPRGRRAARRAAEAAGGGAGRSAGGGGGPRPGRSTRAARNSGRRDVFGGVALGVRVLAALLSLAIIVAGGFYWATYRNFNSNISRVDAIPARGAQPKKDIDGTAQNILIAGNDDRSTASPNELAELGTTEDGGSLNTDTMMVLHVPADGTKAFAISFPRDSYVDIPGHGQAKLNSAYSDGFNETSGSHQAKVGGGARLLIQSIEGLTGITIDHFVMVDLISFYRISNAIGGVEVCLLHAQRPATQEGQDGPGYDSGYEPDGTWVSSYSGINLPAGKSTIKGKQALAFVRQRHGLTSDLDRIKRQQYFLSQTFTKISSKGTLLNPIKQTRLLKAISSSLTFDGDSAGHKGLDPLKLAQQMQNLTAGNLTFSTIPVTNGTSPDGQDILVVDKSTVGAYVKKALGLVPAPKPAAVDTAYAKAKPVDPSTVSISILNGSGVNGAAGTNAQTLNQPGFKTSTGDAAAATTTTTITYPAGMESQAKTLAQYVPGATVTKSSAVQGVTLTLGSDGKKAQATPATAAPPKTSTAPSSTNAPGRQADDGGCIN